MSKRTLLAAAAAAALVATSAAIANDSTAEMTAGGLVLKNSRNIDMLEEDLFVSADEIRVNYVFKNQGRQDENVIVAFPMPDRNLVEENHGDVGLVSDFVTTVEGVRVRSQVEIKAMKGRTDHTALLNRLGIPLVPSRDYVEGQPDAITAAWQRLNARDRAQLTRLGLIEYVDDGAQPLWTVKETHFWRQTFPAGRELRISHRYKPGTGGSVGALLAFPNLRNEAEGRAMIREYCADRAFLAGADRLRREAGENGMPNELRFGYVLRTGANWRSPIRNFRLVVDKGDPRNIVSFCGTGVRQISPTQFEMRRTNWRPTQDLRVLVIRPYERPAD
jgi:hypothetical protein